MEEVTKEISDGRRGAPKMLPQSEWMTTEEAAAYLKMETTRALLRLVRLGRVRGYVLSGTRRHVWRFRKEDL